MVRGSHDHHSSGPWSLKDRTDSDGQSGARGRTVSTRILGIGIVLTGVLILAVGLIMGLEFPNYVREQNKERQCVFFTGHNKYKSWSQGSQWNRKVHLYYWTLANADDFMYKGMTPQFVQRGPYIYSETEHRYNVSFAATEVIFRQLRHHVFDKEGTEAACSVCNEQDVLTIISPWYLQIVGQHGGEEALSWTYIPIYTRMYLHAAGFMSGNDEIFNQNISVLGKFVFESSTFSVPALVNFSFGAWLCSSTRSYRLTLEEMRSPQDLTLTELKSLYNVFTNVTLLGGKALSQQNRSLQQMCRQWAFDMCSSVPPKHKLGSSDCGVIYIFQQCQHRSLSSHAINILQQTFCSPSNHTSNCLNLSGLSEKLLNAYKSAIADFLWHLSRIVLHNFLTDRDLSLVVSKNQSQLAAGYDVLDNNVFQGSREAGLLHYNWVGDKLQTHPQWKVYTCLEKRSITNNMRVKEFNNSWSVPNGLLRGSHKTSLSSFTDYVMPCTLATCRSCVCPGKALSFFSEDLLRATPFWLNDSSLLRGVRVCRYELHPNIFGRSNLLTVEGGLQNMTKVVGYLLWASLPHLTRCEQKLTAHVGINKTVKVANSYILVEPVTGRVWERNIKLQWNVGVSQESARMLSRNISVVELPLPVFWTERVATISDEEIQSYKRLVTRLMTVSCGGVLGFSIIAFIVVIVGIVVCVYPFKPNRVLPIAEDSNSVPNGRHV